MIKQYVKKPIPVKAIKLTNENSEHVTNWLDKEKANYSFCPSGEGLYINTLEGDMKLIEGNYLVQGIRGEFYPCDAEIFEASYNEKMPEICEDFIDE